MKSVDAVAIVVVARVQAQTTFDCNFDSGTTCNWSQEANQDDFDWSIGSQLQVDGYHSIPRTLTGTGSFGYVQGQLTGGSVTATRKAWLLSPVISSLTSPGILRFSYWKAAVPPKLEVAVRSVGREPIILDTISGLGAQAWVQRVVTIPSNPESFNPLVTALTVLSEVQDLMVDSAVMLRSAVGTKTSMSAAQGLDRSSRSLLLLEVVKPSLAASRKTSATASQFVPDGWFGSRFNDFRANLDWRIKNFGRRVGGVPGDPRSSYMFVSGDGRLPSDKASIRSGRFVIPSGAFLEFDAQITNQDTGKLSIYRNDHTNPQNIIWQTLGFRNIGQGWRKVHVALPATGVPMSLVIVAESLLTGNYIAVDNIRLVDSSGREIGCAFANVQRQQELRHRPSSLLSTNGGLRFRQSTPEKESSWPSWSETNGSPLSHNDVNRYTGRWYDDNLSLLYLRDAVSRMLGASAPSALGSYVPSSSLLALYGPYGNPSYFRTKRRRR